MKSEYNEIKNKDSKSKLKNIKGTETVLNSNQLCKTSGKSILSNRNFC